MSTAPTTAGESHRSGGAGSDAESSREETETGPSSINVSVFVGALVIVHSLSAQNPTLPPVRDPVASVPRAPIRIIGVYDEASGQPIPAAEISETATGSSVMTSTTGAANLGFIVPKGGEIRIRKIGFEEQTMTISMAPADTLPITVVMKRVAELPAVVTKDAAPRYLSPTLKSFEERRKNHASGYFIDEATLRKEDNRALGNVLVAHAPGAIVKQVSSANFLLKSPRCSNGGMPDVYVDGVALAHLDDPRRPLPKGRNRFTNPPDPREFPIDLNMFAVRDLAGVEFYPDNATMPVQFSRTAAGCGALFLWTRER